jgi:hypothetical protein
LKGNTGIAYRYACDAARHAEHAEATSKIKATNARDARMPMHADNVGSNPISLCG